MATGYAGDSPSQIQTPRPKPSRRRRGGGGGGGSQSAPASNAPSQAAAGQYTAQSFAQAVLQGLGMPQTPENIQALVAWEAAEGGHWNNTAWFNPLNTTQSMPGATSMNDVGVKAYTSWQEGLAATIKTLKNGNYEPILTALKAGNNAGAVANAVVNSPWGTKTINLDGSYQSYGTSTRNPSTSGVYMSGGSGGLDPNGNSQLTQNDFEQGLDQAGFPKALIDSNPELKKVFDQAVQQKWWLSSAGQERFLTAIKSTQWWKKTTDNQRRIDGLKLTDPTEFQRELTQKLADVRTQAIQLGIGLNPNELNGVAERALTLGLDSNELNQLFASHVKFKSGQGYTGQVGMDVNDIQRLASNYFVKISDGTTQNLLKSLVGGSMDANSLTDYFKELAASKFPHLQKQLNAGQTVSDIADPYKQEMHSLLEVDPNGISNDDPTLLKALQSPTGNGDFQLMPIYQFQNMLRQDPRWLSTDNARNSLMDTTTGLLRQMGLTV